MLKKPSSPKAIETTLQDQTKNIQKRLLSRKTSLWIPELFTNQVKNFFKMKCYSSPPPAPHPHRPPAPVPRVARHRTRDVPRWDHPRGASALGGAPSGASSRLEDFDGPKEAVFLCFVFWEGCFFSFGFLEGEGMFVGCLMFLEFVVCFRGDFWKCLLFLVFCRLFVFSFKGVYFCGFCVLNRFFLGPAFL